MTTEVESKGQEETDSKTGQGLVKISFKDGRGEDVEREVYPEIAEFITSRLEKQRAVGVARRTYERARQQAVWEREDKFFADPDHLGMAFDDYRASRQWDQENRDAAAGYRVLEREYDLFASARYRTQSGVPNSWNILRDAAREAGHKEVVWIVDHCLDNEHEAFLLLQYLPATIDELWKIAKEDHDMCGVFDRYMERATAAGVIKDEDLPVAVREMSAMMNWFRRNFGSGYMGEMRTHVRRIINIEREAAVAEAREQWDKELLAKYAASQDMRELLRSLAQDHPVIQTHLNRSDAARRAAETRRRNQEAEVVATPAEPDEEMEIAF